MRQLASSNHLPTLKGRTAEFKDLNPGRGNVGMVFPWSCIQTEDETSSRNCLTGYKKDKNNFSPPSQMSDGIVERFHPTLTEHLAKIVDKNQKDLKRRTPCQSAIHTTTGETPSKILFGNTQFEEELESSDSEDVREASVKQQATKKSLTYKNASSWNQTLKAQLTHIFNFINSNFNNMDEFTIAFKNSK
ncbi:hypothetical protein HELRODRAFT_166808 [Helobdella robusta]|uniref:Uncharacterized protein n=1 Tax=Helobdella robusta TaxID=6412 RepID=T1EYK0_HELRO|nr:hypothetical protein HELRODRAFT_166808 [Helobdella robusta]ESO11771.1 hypothetical protein HELRODRAFT_166808 [Helobdella robusta]